MNDTEETRPIRLITGLVIRLAILVGMVMFGYLYFVGEIGVQSTAAGLAIGIIVLVLSAYLEVELNDDY